MCWVGQTLDLINTAVSGVIQGTHNPTYTYVHTQHIYTCRGFISRTKAVARPVTSKGLALQQDRSSCLG